MLFHLPNSDRFKGHHHNWIPMVAFLLLTPTWPSATWFPGAMPGCLGQETQQPPTQPVAAGQEAPFTLHPQLGVELFAGEPMLANPANIDIDHRGRVWVCEVVNYRHFRNRDAKPREAGDRILILEDTDGDAKADSQKVFYQGRDIDSAHGVCVLGNRVIVSANDTVMVLVDEDGDDQADRKEVLFTGIGGTQHDHGIHSFLFGPDGKLYFNFGNVGNQLKDANGVLVIDSAGKQVIADGKPYRQGMIFRCNLDGSGLETLAWNFRNNWELCVDSFGGIWQSDNDDDGNRATRINYVMPFGDYGYQDQKTGAHWRTPRTGMHAQVPVRHWHQNDPGVIPNLLLTGAGSPTGICLYEGDALPAVFRNQMIHCDAGPNIVRSYPVTKNGAGYLAESLPLMDGAQHDRWFRPSDVCVAPDGTLIVADWYDPGVGGHRMGDVDKGRLYRLARLGNQGTYAVPKFDVATPEAAAQQLLSPNLATRYLAWQALMAFKDQAIQPLKKLWRHENPRIRARALWALGKLDLPIGQRMPWIRQALNDENPDLRVTAIRLAVQLRGEIPSSEFVGLVNPRDPAPEVRRAILIGMRQLPLGWQQDQFAKLWWTIAQTYRSGDRWLLEALGVAAEDHWDACLEQLAPDSLNDDAIRDLIWRSRGQRSGELLASLIKSPEITAPQCLRYFRAFDFLDRAVTTQPLYELAFGEHDFPAAKAQLVMIESASRVPETLIGNPEQQKLVDAIQEIRGTADHVRVVDRFNLQQELPSLLALVSETSDRQLAADAMSVLMKRQNDGTIQKTILSSDLETRERICDALVDCGQRRASVILGSIGRQKDLSASLRNYAIRRLGETRTGVRDMLRWLDKETVDSVIEPALAAALHSSNDPQAKKVAAQRFPIAATIDSAPLPTMHQLVSLQGDAIRGKQVFDGAGTCAKCHRVQGKGTEVGPDLTEIGNKLTRAALFESILFPSAGISHNYENWMILTDEGQLFVGILIGETDDEIRMKDEKGITHVIPTDQVEDKKQLNVSLMPTGLHRLISQQELVDVVEYMKQLKGKN